MEINKELCESLFARAKENPRLRQNYDLRTSAADTSQRMLNALLPGTVVPIHRHEDTTETVVCLCGRLEEVIYEEFRKYGNEGTRNYGNEETRNFGNEETRNVESTAFPMGMDAQDVARKVEYREVQRILLCPAEGKYGCQIPKGAWHTVEVIEPSMIFEAKDGAYIPK